MEDRAIWFSHKAVVATPYYYRTYLADYDVVTEISPTERAAIIQFTFPKTDEAYIVIDAFDKGSSVTIHPEEKRVTGYTTKNSGGVPDNFRNYFVIEFDKPFEYTASVNDGIIDSNSTSSTSNHSGAIVGFKTERGEKVNARIAS